MPLFDFRCQDCAHAFEDLILASEKPACPKCGGKKVEKQLPVFAVNTGRNSLPSTPPPGSCGSCGDPRGPGSCSM